MNTDTILQEFLKYASMPLAMMNQPHPPSTITEPTVSGQPLKRTSNIPEANIVGTNGNTVNIKPLTNPKKLKTI